MKFKLSALAFLAAAACSASTVSCALGVADVTTLTIGNGCTEAGFTDQNFVIDTSAGITAVVSLLGADYINDAEDLHFGITTTPAFIGPHGSDSIWVRMTYNVHEDAPWIDSAELHNIDGVGVVIFETVCSVHVLNNQDCPDANVLAKFHASGGEDVSASFQSTDDVYIMKTMVFGDASLTKFDNYTGAPEPVSTSMIGGGLLALGLLARRKLHAK